MKRIDIIGLNGNTGEHYDVIKPKKRKSDDRPICNCDAYKFPHKIGGKCTGHAFLEFHFYNIRECCELCNCFRDDQTPMTCDAMTGAESITEAECYTDRLHYYPGEHLPINFIET